MQKNVTRGTLMLYIAILHPSISCLIWLLLSRVTQIVPAQSIMREGLALLQFLVMVISSALLYWLVKKTQCLYPYQIKTMLAVSYVVFMVMMGLVAAKSTDYMSEEAVLQIELLVYYTIYVTGIFFIFFLVAIVAECIVQEVKTKKNGFQIREEEIEISKAKLTNKAIVYSVISCMLWFILMWIYFHLPNNIKPLYLGKLCWYMQRFLIIVTSVLVYYWEIGNQILDFYQLRKKLVFLNILSMAILFLVYLRRPSFLPTEKISTFTVAMTLVHTLVYTSYFLGFLIIAVIIEWIIRKVTKS